MRESDGTVARIATILGVLAEATQSLGIKQISQAAELPMSTTHRLLGLLSDKGFVEKIPSIHKYRLGKEFLRIAATTIYKNPFSGIVQPILDEITAKVNETSAFALYHQAGRVISYHAKSDSRQPLRFRMSLNQRMDLISNAFGHAVLAFLPEPARNEAIVAAPTYGKFRNRSVLLTHLSGIGQEGYALSEDHDLSSVCYIAAPVKALGDNVLGAIGLVIPAVRLDRSQIRTYCSTVTEAAKKLSYLQ